MKKLIQRHYFAVTQLRSKYTRTATISDFINKFHEESTEMLLEKEKFIHKIPNNFKQEVIDTVMVLLNMLQKLGVDIEEELRINTEHQETRKD